MGVGGRGTETTVLLLFALSVRGISQRKLAERLGVTQATISAIISRPSFPTLERIATALDVEPWQLLAPPSIVEELK